VAGLHGSILVHLEMKTLKPATDWLSGLPTEYQFSLSMALLMLICYLLTPYSLSLDGNFSTIVTGLGSLAGAALIHGGFSRSKWSDADSKADLMGTPTGGQNGMAEK